MEIKRETGREGGEKRTAERLPNRKGEREKGLDIEEQGSDRGEE